MFPSLSFKSSLGSAGFHGDSSPVVLADVKLNKKASQRGSAAGFCFQRESRDTQSSESILSAHLYLHRLQVQVSIMSAMSRYVNRNLVVAGEPRPERGGERLSWSVSYRASASQTLQRAELRHSVMSSVICLVRGPCQSAARALSLDHK